MNIDRFSLNIKNIKWLKALVHLEAQLFLPVTTGINWEEGELEKGNLKIFSQRIVIGGKNLWTQGHWAAIFWLYFGCIWFILL